MKNPRTLSRIIIAMLFTLCCNFAFAANDGPYSGNGGDFGGGGAGGSWGSDSATCSDGTAKTYSYYPNSYHSSLASVCAEIATKEADAHLAKWGLTIRNDLSPIEPNICHGYAHYLDGYKAGQTAGPLDYKVTVSNNSCSCAADEYYSLSSNTCVKKTCDLPYVYDPVADKCVDDEKKCPTGQHLDSATKQCVDDSKPPCDPAIQECDENGNSKCDCCAKLDTIISNQQTQISLHNTTNQSLIQILTNAQQTNQKIDVTNQKLDQVIALLSKDPNQTNFTPIIDQLKSIKQSIDNLHKDDFSKINDYLDKILQAIKDNKYDDKSFKDLVYKGFDDLNAVLLKKQPQAIASAVSPVLASAVKPITEKQDEQTDLLAQIRDLLVGKPNEGDEKQQPPDPNAPENEHEQKPEIDPWAAIKGFDISQNKINAIKQCPAPKSFVLANNTFNFDFSYLCQFLSALSPIFLALAYFKGAAVIVGSWGD